MWASHLIEHFLKVWSTQAIGHVAIGAVREKELSLSCDSSLYILPPINVLLTPVHNTNIAYEGGREGGREQGREGGREGGGKRVSYFKLKLKSHSREWAIALESKKWKVPRHQMLYTRDVEKVILISTIPSNLALDAPVNEE